MTFAKSWTDKYNDGWYLSLKLHERGLWDQLFTYAKMVGDTGRITGRSWSAWGSLWGCDGKTVRKILGKFHENGKIILKYGEVPGKFPGNIPDLTPNTKNRQGNILELEIVNYHYYQRVKKVGDNIPQGNPTEISPYNKTRQDKTIEEKNMAENIQPVVVKEKKKKETNPEIKQFIDRWFEQYQLTKPSGQGTKYVIQRGKDNGQLERLLKQLRLAEIWPVAKWFIGYDGDHFVGRLGKQIANFCSQYNTVRQQYQWEIDHKVRVV